MRAPAGARVVLSEDASIVDASGAALVDVVVTAHGADGDTMTGTFTEAAANSRKMSGNVHVLPPGRRQRDPRRRGRDLPRRVAADGARHTVDVAYGCPSTCPARRWALGPRCDAFLGREVRGPDEGGGRFGARRTGWTVGDRERRPEPSVQRIDPDCDAVQLREFAADPGPVNIPISGGTVLVAGSDYILDCDDSLDGVPVVSATIPSRSMVPSICSRPRARSRVPSPTSRRQPRRCRRPVGSWGCSTPSAASRMHSTILRIDPDVDPADVHGAKRRRRRHRGGVAATRPRHDRIAG